MKSMYILIGWRECRSGQYINNVVKPRGPGNWEPVYVRR